MPINPLSLKILAIFILVHGAYQVFGAIILTISLLALGGAMGGLNPFETLTFSTISFSLFALIGILEILAAIGLLKYKKIGFNLFYIAALIHFVLVFTTFYISQDIQKLMTTNNVIAAVALIYILFEHRRFALARR